MRKTIKAVLLTICMVMCMGSVAQAEETYVFNGIAEKLESVQNVNTELTITADVSGDTDMLQYKFVWMKDNWNKWGVLKAFDMEAMVTWCPEESGKYTIYVDVQDTEGNIVTYKRDFDIVNYKWTYRDIFTDKATPQTMENLPITISADVDDSKGLLEYKFVWMKDNWNKWGVLQEFSPNKEIQWKPECEGVYTIYVDVRTPAGEVKTKNIDYTISSGVWNYDSVSVFPEKEQLCGKPITISANVSGNTKNLTYKFVWMKDNWNEWGVIRDFSADSSIEWTIPCNIGEYVFYVDVKSADGSVESKTINFTSRKAEWELESIVADGKTTIPYGSSFDIDISVSGAAEGLQYKIVWMKDNWNDWGVLKTFGPNEAFTWRPEKAGEYVLYVDVMDSYGNIHSPSVTQLSVYSFDKVQLSSAYLEAGKSVTISPGFVGKYDGKAEFKYVWETLGWKEWGVIADFSTADQMTWTPQAEGYYNIYVDMRIDDQTIITKQISLYVGDPYAIKIGEIKNTYLNVPYKWGGSTPAGWDCSGFTQWALAYLGVSIPRSSSSQAQGGQAVNPFDVSQWKIGDIVCFRNNSGKISHAALYIGDGKIMHALNSKAGTVIHDALYFDKIDTTIKIAVVRRYLNY